MPLGEPGGIFYFQRVSIIKVILSFITANGVDTSVSTVILPPTAENIDRAAQALAAGEVVAMPTETVYGLAGVAFDDQALAKIFSTKERPTFDPLIVHLASPEQGSEVTDWVEHLAAWQLIDTGVLSPTARERVQRLASEFWPGPLTLVLPKSPAVPDLATSGLPTVAVRMPRHPVAQALLKAIGQPLAAPSANRFGRISPTSAEHVLTELGGRIELILDGGPCEIGLESTVLAVQAGGELTLLRPGGTPVSAIAAAVGAAVQTRQPSPNSTEAAPASPGLLASHYAPSKPLKILPAAVFDLQPHEVEQVETWLADQRGLGLLLQTGETSAAAQHLRTLLAARSDLAIEVRTLSRTGDTLEAARRLFASLRVLDESPQVTLVLAEPVAGTEGLAHAIADRLRRASAAR